MGDAGIVRNRAKIDATIGNARAYLKEEDFATFAWSFVDGRPKQNRWRERAQVPAETDESRALSKALAKKGYKFVGPTIVYAWMQACGLVNDHTTRCFRHQTLSATR